MNMPEPAARRLKALRERSGKTIRQIAEELDLGDRHSTYSSYEGAKFKKAYIPMDLAKRLVPVFTGFGEPPIQKAEVLALAGTEAGEGREMIPLPRDQGSLEPPPPGYIVVREYAADGAAGAGREPVLNWSGEAEALAEWIIPKDFLPPEHRNATVAVVRVQGDSMAPSLQPHDRVMVDVSHNWLGADGAYMAWNGLGVVFKRLQALPGNPPKVRFFSDNPAYEAYTLPSDEVKIFGRVIGKWTWW